MLRTKIKMTDGAEYHVDKTIEEIDEIRNNSEYEFIKVKDYKKNKIVNIKLGEIASIEQFSEPEFTAKWM